MPFYTMLEKHKSTKLTNKELGNITANAKSRLKYTSGAGSDLKYKIAPKLNEMVQTAEYIGTELPLNGKNNKFVKVHKLANKANTRKLGRFLV